MAGNYNRRPNYRGGRGRQIHKKGKGRKRNNFDKALVQNITRTINGFKDLRDLNDLDARNVPHFADEGGYAYKIAYQFSSYGELIKTNQLRKFYGEIKSIEREGTWEKAELGFNLLKPKFAISVSRKSNDQPLIHIEFYKLIKAMMDKVPVENEPEISYYNLGLFSRFFESIVAYHKLHELNFEIDKKNRGKNRNNRNRGRNQERNEKPSDEYERFNVPNSNYDYAVIKEIIDDIAGFNNLQDLKEVPQKLKKPSFEDVGGYGDKIAYQFSQKGKKINSNQIRRYYGEIKRIERYGNWEDAKNDFYLFKPRMAIAVARTSSGNNLIPLEFYNLIKITMDKVNVKNNAELSFKNLELFADFFEAIVGFHKYYNL